MTLATNDSRLTAMARDRTHQATLMENRNAMAPYERARMNELRSEAFAIRAALKELADLRLQVANWKEGTVSDAGN